ncbi:MAG TPA: FAD binding domain-containing protein [Terriglobales bacterium]
MRAFEYAAPTTKEQAVSLLGTQWGHAEVIAGGTDMLSLMKDDVVRPKRLVSIQQLQGLDGSSSSRGLEISAVTTLAELANNINVMKDYPALADAIDEAASPQIRNMATLGGNLCQRPRCWYFRGGYGLLPKDESGKDLAAAGNNRYHAILGNAGPAKFVSPSSIVPALIAYGAKIQLFGPKGTRELAIENFYVIPKSDGEREHDLKPNEIVTRVILPGADKNLKVAHYEVRQKAAFDWPLAVAAVALRMDGSRIQDARVVMGHVAPVPWISGEAANVLVSKNYSEDLARQAADAALTKATPLSQNAYKVQLARVAVKRAIVKAAGGTS